MVVQRVVTVAYRVAPDENKRAIKMDNKTRHNYTIRIRKIKDSGCAFKTELTTEKCYYVRRSILRYKCVSASEYIYFPTQSRRFIIVCRYFFP